jgi:thiol-disulfide isomerase/thioredoxin
METHVKQRNAAILSLIVLVVLVAGAIVYLHFRPSTKLQNASTAPSTTQLAVGDTAPQFSLPSTAGEFDLDAQTKPVFLEVFATWCPHCQRMTVVLDKLYAAYGSRVSFIAIPGSDTGMDETSPETQFDVLNFQIHFNVKYPIAAYDPNLTVAKEYILGGYPTLVVIGKNKKIAYINSGEQPYATLASALNAALK